jgi:hypothetical protein
MEAMTPSPLAAPLLAIETSCDETAAAVLAPGGTVLAETLLSQLDHVPYQGVVPLHGDRREYANDLPDPISEASPLHVLAYYGLGRHDLELLERKH